LGEGAGAGWVAEVFDGGGIVIDGHSVRAQFECSGAEVSELSLLASLPPEP
jgi:hypothetical protein